MIFFMALKTKFHFQWNRRLGEWEGPFDHVPVALLARDFTQHNVPAMGKIDIVGHSMYLFPRNPFFFIYVAN